MKRSRTSLIVLMKSIFAAYLQYMSAEGLF